MRRSLILLVAALSLFLSSALLAQTPLNANSDLANLGAGSYSWPAGLTVPNGKNIRGVRGQTTILLTADSGGQGMQYKGDNWSVKDVILKGARVHLDKAGGFNTNINFDNVEFRNSVNEGLHFTTGLANSRISNCLFIGNKSHGIYGYNYLGLVIANNEFVDNGAGAHIDAFGASGNLLVEQNYLAGCDGMGLEYQGTASNLIFQDNYYEKPRATNNSSKMAWSLILDKSKNITIRRNYAMMPIKTGDTYVRIVFELGGDNTVCEDNYSNGGNHVVAVNDGVGSASVTVRNNRFLNYAQGISNSFPSADRTLTQSNNGPNVALSWDITRPKPARNVRTGAPATLPTTVPTVPPGPSELDQVKARLTASQAEVMRLSGELGALKAKIIQAGDQVKALGQ